MIYLRMVLLAVVTVSFFSGCTKTWVGGVAYFPQDANSKSAKYRLVLDVEGAYRKAYTARTNKFIRLVIWNNDKKQLLHREYTVTAADLEWDVQWDNQDDLQITFFDFPEGKSGYGDSAFKLPAKEIFSVSYTYDSASGTFTEKVLRREILNHARRLLKTGN